MGSSQTKKLIICADTGRYTRVRSAETDECVDRWHRDAEAIAFFGTHGESVLRELSALRARCEELERLGREMREAEAAMNTLLDRLSDGDITIGCEAQVRGRADIRRTEKAFDAAIARGKA